jgi:hypothetical protein
MFDLAHSLAKTFQVFGHYQRHIFVLISSVHEDAILYGLPPLFMLEKFSVDIGRLQPTEYQFFAS